MGQGHRKGTLLAVKNLGIVYQERSLNAAEMAVHLTARLSDRLNVWSLASHATEELRQLLEQIELQLVTVQELGQGQTGDALHIFVRGFLNDCVQKSLIFLAGAVAHPLTGGPEFVAPDMVA